MSAPFLFIQARPAGAIADDERRAIETLGGLREGDSLRSVMLIEEPHWDPERDCDLEDFAGVIISGSPYSAIADVEMSDPRRAHLYRRVGALVRRLVATDTPTLGLCYGLQMVAVAQGEVLSEATSEDLQAVTIELTPEGFVDPVCARLAPIMRGFVGHTYSLQRTPPGAVLLGRGTHCEQQLVRFGRNVYGTQFHPEITTPGMQLRIDAYAGHYYDGAQVREVVERCMSQDVTTANALIGAFIDHYRNALPAETKR